MLDIDKIHTYYGKSHILYDVSMEVNDGATVALLGRNGVGKSTTLKSVIGISSPQEGSIRFKGEEIVGLRTHKICRLGVGYVPEERRIFPNITVRQNFLIGLKPNQRVEDPWTIDAVCKYFPVLGKRADFKAGNLSGGEQQMLSVGRTLMGNPQLLLIDEPTEGLAPFLKEMLMDMLGKTKESGCAILLVEQNMDIALHLAERAYVMAKGRVVFHGSSEEVRGNKEIRKKYLEV